MLNFAYKLWLLKLELFHNWIALFLLLRLRKNFQSSKNMEILKFEDTLKLSLAVVFEDNTL